MSTPTLLELYQTPDGSFNHLDPFITAIRSGAIKPSYHECIDFLDKVSEMRINIRVTHVSLVTHNVRLYILIKYMQNKYDGIYVNKYAHTIHPDCYVYIYDNTIIINSILVIVDYNLVDEFKKWRTLVRVTMYGNLFMCVLCMRRTELLNILLSWDTYKFKLDDYGIISHNFISGMQFDKYQLGIPYFMNYINEIKLLTHNVCTQQPDVYHDAIKMMIIRYPQYIGYVFISMYKNYHDNINFNDYKYLLLSHQDQFINYALFLVLRDIRSDSYDSIDQLTTMIVDNILWLSNNQISHNMNNVSDRVISSYNKLALPHACIVYTNMLSAKMKKKVYGQYLIDSPFIDGICRIIANYLVFSP